MTINYSPINKERSKIKLLTVKAGEADDRLSCSLSVASLSKKLEYEAL